VLRVSICPREVAILTKESTTIWVAGGVPWMWIGGWTPWAELRLEIRQAGTPGHGAPGKVSAQNFSKVMCRRSTIRGLDTLGATTTTDRLEVVDLHNGDYCTTS
jgi:hypothetical protein